MAYSFRAYLLEAKLFDQRAKAAETLERKFLETYFGTNPQIVGFARYLISLGDRAAARALNEAVRVLGNRIEADRVIKGIRDEFGVGKSIGLEAYRAFALRLGGWGYEEADIRDQLVSRGLKLNEAEVLARTVVRRG